MQLKLLKVNSAVPACVPWGCGPRSHGSLGMKIANASLPQVYSASHGYEESAAPWDGTMVVLGCFIPFQFCVYL